MIKPLILLTQVFGLFFYQLILTGDLAITQKIPESISVDSEGLVEINIKKGDIKDFAQVQQVCPEGFSVELIDANGATFSFKDNKVKFIWMALPSEEEFTISYKIKPNEGVVGSFTLGGKFSYILGGERKSTEISVSSFKVVDNNAIANSSTSSEKTKRIADSKQLDVKESAQVKVKGNRTVKNIGNGKYKVMLEINKSDIQGFAKITEKIPPGFMANEDDSKGGVFSAKEHEAKIFWMEIPENEIFEVTYVLQADKDTKSGKFIIIGSFSYLENDITSKSDIGATGFEFIMKEQLVEEEKTVAKETKEEPILEKTKNTISNIVKPENGVSYKVQVAAGHKKVESNYFASRYMLKDKISTLNHKGWIKYLVGNFGEYESARNKRNSVRNNVKTAFVTAYNSGKRITVQEALMISNQKWYK